MPIRPIPTRSSIFASVRMPGGALDALDALRCRWRAARRRDAERAALRALDASALRDLGVCRSEIESVQREAAGAVAPTRRRIARPSSEPPRAGPRTRSAGGDAPRRPWLRSAWPIGLLLAAAAAGWQPAAPEADGAAPAAERPATDGAYLPAQFGAQQAAASIEPQPEPF